MRTGRASTLGDETGDRLGGSPAQRSIVVLVLRTGNELGPGYFEHPAVCQGPTAAYHLVKDGTFYQDLGATHFDRRRPDAQARRLIKRLADLGFSVQLKPAAAVS